MKGGVVYIMTNRRNGTLYTGVTSNLPRRAYQHREGLIDGFTKEHGLKMLVYYEVFDGIRDTLQREKNMKHWPRAWKVRLIHGMNPEWTDLYERCFEKMPSHILRHARPRAGHPRLALREVRKGVDGRAKPGRDRTRL